MGRVDLRIEHLRRSRLESSRLERNRRMRQIKTTATQKAPSATPSATPSLPQIMRVNVDPSNTNVGTQQTMYIELWEAAKNGDVENFLKCLEEFTEEKNIPLTTILSQLTFPQKDTFLHVAASFGHEDFSGFIADHFRDLITCKNLKGDSALHLAARGGHLGVVKVISNCQKSLYSDFNRDDGLLLTDEERMKLLEKGLEERVAENDEGSTPLHEALLNDHMEIVDYLIKGNVEAAYHVNKEGKSPLYMAVEAGNTDLVKYILNGRSEYMHLLDEQLTRGKSLLHAAVMTRNIAVLQMVTEKKHMLIRLGPVDFASLIDIASSIGYLEGVTFLQDELNKKTGDHDNGPKHRSKPHPMNLALYLAAKKGNIDGFIDACTPRSSVRNQITPLKNTVLHVAASFGNKDLVGYIVHNFVSLLSKRNHRGDTALHAAAIAGQLGVVDVLVKFQIESKSSPLNVDQKRNNETVVGKLEDRVVINDDGNTPLHEALKNNHDTVAGYLIVAKIEDAFHVNKQGKSALYIAVEMEKINSVKTILSTMLSYPDQRILDEEITKGKSLIHATITARNTVLLKEIAKMKAAVIHAKNEYGQTPLHHAASINFLGGVEFLIDTFKMDIFEQDAYGFYPIHSASKNGHVGILEMLLQHCPDAREFVNEDNQNILHVAAKYGKDNVVRYILNTPDLGLLLNEKDENGDSPLHLATINWYPKVVSSLTWDKRVDLGLVNIEGLTALDAAEESMEATTSYRQRLTWMALKSAGTEKAKLQNKPKLKRLMSATKEQYNMDYGKERVNTLLLVSTLVATVTFAAGFTVPGGYRNSKPDEGMATLLRKLAFQVFVICDTIAVYSAIMVAVSLIWAQLGDLSLVLSALKLAIPLLGISLTMMSLAFMAGVYLVVSTLVWLANVVLILGTISLACLLALFIPLNLPYTSTFTILRYISYYPFCLLMLASGSYYDPDVEQNVEQNSIGSRSLSTDSF
ncbi:PGG domain-containing protein [Heracleum sosnowskyi]|uniref:PGG domain-containing protein n=1 Tax=Heracleum sosnowskyi TaxID=360622 RepID=A0AAD8HRA7_9APIA|nr:PGG domain-containing protein [Heracleum sosnowskyi]